MKKNDYAEVLKELESKHGELTPDMVLQEAEDESSPLHEYFDWDDTIAAVKWRRHQARKMILSIKVVVETTERVLKIPNYVRDPDKAGDEQGYRSVVALKKDEDAKREAIVSEFARAATALRRARDLADFFGLEQQVDDTLMSVERMTQSAARQ